MNERLCTHYREDYGLETRIVRFHNVFGPFGTPVICTGTRGLTYCPTVLTQLEGVVETTRG